MGKSKKKLNFKSCLKKLNELNQSSSKSQVDVELDLNIREEKYDACNALVLPPKDQRYKTEQKIKKDKKKKPLSKKQKKRLMKILEKKQRNVNRSDLLEKLQEVQATQKDLELLTSTSSMQTGGFKRTITELSSESHLPVKVNNVKGSKKNLIELPKKKIKLDPNIVGYEDDSDESDDDDDDDDDKDKEEEIQKEADQENKEDSSCLEKENIGSQSTEDSIIPVVEQFDESKNTINPSCENDTKIPQSDTKNDVPVPCKPAVFIPVHRTPEIQAIREALPIYTEEQAIMEAIQENPVVVIHGTTGSGKTTQVPQFLYEAGYTENNKLIGITEPRRIAAVQMAQRVGEEMNLQKAVSYHIRYEKTTSDSDTRIKFMTDGVLLREIQHDFFLTRYSVIIIDEAHERSVFSDILIGLLSRIILIRQERGKPLKLIIMSATLKVEDFLENAVLFKQRPFLITLDSRQYDVTIHFNTKTPVDYIQAAYEKVCKVHRKLPAGAILAFVTGEKEVTRLCKMLSKSFPYKNKESNKEEKKVPVKSPKKKGSYEKKIVTDELKTKKTQNELFSELLPKIDLDDYSVEPLDNEGVQHQDSENEDNDSDCDDFISGKHRESDEVCEPLYVLPLYSVLPTEEQSKIFKPPPEGCRLCVIATNVAETSVTIPGLKYVIDTGKVKTRVYDKIASGVSNFAITWTSKASANQRAGRAGRTEGGHCYRLYSSAVFENELPDHTAPDIQRIPVDDILLQMKSLGIDKVVHFPFPAPPEIESLKAAEKRLVKLGALEDLQKGLRFKDIKIWEFAAKITPLGKAMARFPLSPRLAKMLLLSHKHNVISYVIALVSALSVTEVFLASSGSENSNDGEFSGIRKIGTGEGKKGLQMGDAMVLLRAVAMYEECRNKRQFCSKYGIRIKAMVEIHKMRLQLIREANRTFTDIEITTDLRLEPPSEETTEKLRKILTCGLIDHVARKMSDEEMQNFEPKLVGAYTCLDLDEPIYIHPSSVLTKQLPQYVVYQDIFQTAKYFMRVVSEIEPEWLTAFATSQCEFSAPREPYYDGQIGKIMCKMTSTFGTRHWMLPEVIMPMPEGFPKYTRFCFFLLDGQVCPALKKFTPSMKAKPTMILNFASSLPRNLLALLQALVKNKVDSRDALYDAWENNSNFLLSEYQEWLKGNSPSIVWPPKE